MPDMYEQESFEQAEAAAKERRELDEFRRTWKGSGDAEAAFRVKKSVDAAELKEKARVAQPDKAALASIQETFGNALMMASRFRNVEFDAEDVAEVVRQAVDDSGIPPRNKADLTERLTAIVLQAAKSGDFAKARHDARAAAFRVAQGVAKTWQPPSDKYTDDERESILARIPRA